MESQNYLIVEGLRKNYQELRAVDDISFSVTKGEVFGLLGPNGAGKTTTIKMLCGLIKADAGHVTLGGISMAKAYKRVKTKIGFCPQDIVLWELLTCFEQLKFMGMSYGLSTLEASKRTDHLLGVLELSDKKNKLAKTLSGGMQRRLNIALALVHNPELIILDEPQAGLDPQSRVLVRDFIRELAKEKTVILTTHDMDEADRLSHRIAIIDHGKILLIDTPEKLKEKSGMGDVLQVRVSDANQVSIDKLLGEMPLEITQKKYSDGLFLLGGKDILELIPKVNQLFKKYQFNLQDMTIRKRTLEDAFIAMTGRGLRE